MSRITLRVDQVCSSNMIIQKQLPLKLFILTQTYTQTLALLRPMAIDDLTSKDEEKVLWNNQSS